ncbi:nucleoside-diphosphate sugar epimerase/dehydratase [Pseudomonas canadensis]|uniref:polysaccharide biosynthesis protein n=1 Tax=Pseudomonas canadensis TaxID=915099 RepID=UPI0030D3091A
MKGNVPSIRDRLLALPRRDKRALQVAIDVVLIWLALWLAFFIRLDDVTVIKPLGAHAWLFFAGPALALPLFLRMGLYRAVMRYVGTEALLKITKAATLSALLLTLVIYLYGETPALVPRSIVFNYWWLSLLLIGGSRVAVRQYFSGEWHGLLDALPFRQSGGGRPRVVIYGAGAAGNQLVSALRMDRTMQAVAFMDDDVQLNNRLIAGLPVYQPKHIERMIKETGAEQLLLAIPSTSRARRREVLEMLEPFPLHVRSVPGFMDLANGRVKVEDLQEVDIADLLGRDPVEPHAALFERCIRAQVVMVTGAGGSIGSELCRQIIGLEPTTLILFDHSEFNMYSIHGELEQRIRREKLPLRLLPVLGSVRDTARLLDVMGSWGVDTVYHAAAYKHVPMVEHNVAEGVLNNTLGTLNTAQAALQAGVRNFVLISTDKAVRPTNVMGCTKRMAEMVLQALADEPQVALFDGGALPPVANRTRFTMVRFGNVLGSSGSVIPLFREQIKRGGPLTVTHPEITRYFMTIPEAAQLVIQAGAMGKGGDVFVLDMGQPVKIAQLAEKMVHLSGLTVCSPDKPDGDIAIEFSGLRPGEKLYEELLIGDSVLPTEHRMIMRASEERLSWSELKSLLGSLVIAIEQDDYYRMRELLCQMVSGYTPDAEIVDLLHCQQDSTTAQAIPFRPQVVTPTQVFAVGE